MPPSSSSTPPASDPPPTVEETDYLERSTYKPNADDIVMTEMLPQPSPRSFRDTLVTGGFSSMQSSVSIKEIRAANPGWDEQPPIVTDPITGVRVKAPEVFLTTEILEKLCLPWRHAVIIKLLGKSISFFTLQARLHRDWKTEKDFDIIDIGLGFYIVRFFSDSECQRILTNGPYKIYDHYLAVQPWEANFQPSKAKLPKTAVWVHLEAAPMECFQESMLYHFASLLGKPIKIDQTTLLATRGRFARVCVELDLNESLPVSITV